jgi:hypothetical protein
MVVAAAEKSMHLLAAAMLDSMKATKRKSDLAIGTGIYR